MTARGEWTPARGEARDRFKTHGTASRALRQEALEYVERMPAHLRAEARRFLNSGKATRPQVERFIEQRRAAEADGA